MCTFISFFFSFQQLIIFINFWQLYFQFFFALLSFLALHDIFNRFINADITRLIIIIFFLAVTGMNEFSCLNYSWQHIHMLTSWRQLTWKLKNFLLIFFSSFVFTEKKKISISHFSLPMNIYVYKETHEININCTVTAAAAAGCLYS